MRLFRPRSSATAAIAAAATVVVLLLIPAETPVLCDAAAETVPMTQWTCPRCPICSVGGVPLMTKLFYCLPSSLPSVVARRELPFDTNKKLRRRAMEDVEELLLTHVVGQEHVTSAIVDAMRRKLANPREPLVLHFAGDNGVGKTYTARLLSLATSLRCSVSRPQCDAGDNLLVVSGTGYDGLPVADARKRIVTLVTAHQRLYPHGIVLLDDLSAMHPNLVAAAHQRLYPHGIVLLDDLSAMHPNLVAALAPLFGRAERFAEQPHDVPSLTQLTVIATTDFGRQGRTWGRSLVQVQQMVRDEFASLYGTLVPAYARTMVFVSFTRRAAERMVHNAVAALPCTAQLGGGHVVASSIEDVAVAFLVERHREMWEGKENGHALRRAVEDTLVPLVLRYFDAHGYDRLMWARFHLDMRAAEIVLHTDESGPHDEEDVAAVSAEVPSSTPPPPPPPPAAAAEGEEDAGGSRGGSAEDGKGPHTLNDDL
ncbi:hypothetical protein DQ04_07221050 [Trypanosoma grayi]|uniref:hypothetical protein n=1 Tax=Trypanosoma grayi TaxID=71804 RepID=UPI0004F43B1D|nr:hypothetical protein DQ04_07221050 [Trypanosoma grayi]KEG08424.1 hypothetical protein DQ04_07221050 [Trypanosoma grayi]